MIVSPRMGFVKTPEEISRIEAAIGSPSFSGAQACDASVSYGRDVFGEPKKIARPELFRRGDRFTARDQQALEPQLQVAPGGERARPRGGRDPHPRRLRAAGPGCPGGRGTGPRRGFLPYHHARNDHWPAHATAD